MSDRAPTTQTWYDGLLAAMPASLAGGAVVGWLLAIPFALGIGAGSVLAAIFLGISMFVIPPN